MHIKKLNNRIDGRRADAFVFERCLSFLTPLLL